MRCGEIVPGGTGVVTVPQGRQVFATASRKIV